MVASLQRVAETRVASAPAAAAMVLSICPAGCRVTAERRSRRPTPAETLRSNFLSVASTLSSSAVAFGRAAVQALRRRARRNLGAVVVAAVVVAGPGGGVVAVLVPSGPSGPAAPLAAASDTAPAHQATGQA